jgi:hypothetical protein
MLAPKKSNGFEFNVREIGFLFTIAGASVLPAQLFFYQGVAKRVGNIAVSRVCIIVGASVCLLLPYVSLLRNESTTASWWMISLMNCIIQVSFTFVNTGWLVWINNSCPAIHRGTINGLAQSFVSMGRAAGPAAMGALFALTTGGGLAWPLNHHTAFIVEFALALFVFAMTIFAPVALDPRLEKERNAVATSIAAHDALLMRFTRAAQSQRCQGQGQGLGETERALLGNICELADAAGPRREGCLLRTHEAMRAWATRVVCARCCCFVRCAQA